MAASNNFIQLNPPSNNNTFRVGLNTREMSPNDIISALHDANYIGISDVNAVISNENAPADWSSSRLTDFSGANLIQNPKRSLEAIINERKQAIENEVQKEPSGNQFERLKSELTAFVNGVIGTAAKVFANNSEPDSFLEASTINSKFGSGSPELREVIDDISAHLISLCSDRPAIDNFKGQLVYLLDLYKLTGRELKKAEATLRSKLEEFDRLKSDVSILLRTGDGGEEFLALQAAYLAYAKKHYSTTGLEETYKCCLNLYKKWALLRDIVMSVRIAGSGGQGSGPTCGICLEDPVSHVIGNCGHTFCGGCMSQISRSCPICRKSFHSPATRIYFT